MTETELLFSEILGCDRPSLYANKDLLLNKDRSLLIASVLKRRILRQPIDYILGKAEFMGLEFKVTPDVLIPRPETEILVETALKISCQLSHACRQAGVVSCQLKILDIGTGSGCIAVSLAKILANANITATDISPKAIDIARQNAILNNVSDKVNFIHSNLFTDYRLPITDYDIIVSNPPYIPVQEIDNLPAEVKSEPRIALDGGEDGLFFYRRIINEARHFLKKRGFLIMEMGFDQRQKIENIFRKYENFGIIDIIKDYNNIDRIIIGQRIA